MTGCPVLGCAKCEGLLWRACRHPARAEPQTLMGSREALHLSEVLEQAQLMHPEHKRRDPLLRHATPLERRGAPSRRLKKLTGTCTTSDPRHSPKDLRACVLEADGGLGCHAVSVTPPPIERVLCHRSPRGRRDGSARSPRAQGSKRTNLRDGRKVWRRQWYALLTHEL